MKNKKPKTNEHFKDIKKHLLTDKDLSIIDKLIGDEKDWVHKGSIKTVGKLLPVPHGPGSQLMKSSEIQYEGIWIDGKMVGAGYMITFDSDRNITDVMKCVNGHPTERVHIQRGEPADSKKSLD